MRILLFIHLIAIATWVGGQIAIAVVVMPALRAETDLDRRRMLIRAAGRRFGVVSIPLFAVIIATGIGMLDYVPSVAHTPTFMWKMTCVAVAIVSSGLHSWVARRGHKALAGITAALALATSIAAVWLATGL